ncbi:DNA-processing protein DprA [Arhodomonas sp. AD133]|uniref:DNA-processing protein DprA n=1 Tax=Arhodomonas sp. AD133 TaxID=3415009 RepID=UPI003EBE93FD
MPPETGATGQADTTEVAAWLRLLRTPGVGPSTYNAILAAFDSPAHFFDADAASIRAAALDPDLRASAPDREDADIAADLAWLTAPDHHLITRHDPHYPEQLAAIADPPPLLFVAGAAALLQRPQLAIVGSRKATRGGLDNAREFARHLAGNGLAITSGLALGIDGAAHRGALSAPGATVAVTATGPDRIYPAHHRDLAREIAGGGAIVTEFPTGVRVRREQFPRRNRVISGLALGVLVVEAGVRSGSLLTARHALEQGREVFAIPGSIHNPLARGCHALIRQGAKLVESAADVFDELPPLPIAEAPADTRPTAAGAEDATAGAGDAEPALNDDYQALLEALGHDPVSFDVLAERAGLTADTLSSMLLILELKGYVTASPGGRYARLR